MIRVLKVGCSVVYGSGLRLEVGSVDGDAFGNGLTWMRLINWCMWIHEMVTICIVSSLNVFVQRYHVVHFEFENSPLYRQYNMSTFFDHSGSSNLSRTNDQ